MNWQFLGFVIKSEEDIGENWDKDSLTDFILTKPTPKTVLLEKSNATMKWFEGKVGTDNIKDILRKVRSEDVMTKAVQQHEIKWNSVNIY